MSDPVNTVYPDGSPVAKGSVRDYESSREILVLASAAEIQTLSIYRLVVFFGRSLYAFDAADTSSAHNGSTMLVSANGRRYRRIVTLDNATAEEVAAQLSAAGVPTTAISFEAPDRVLGSGAGGDPVEMTGSDVAGMIDTALGSNDWREGAGAVALSSRVDYLPANAWTGMIGEYGRLVMMGDGSIRACGYGGRSFNGDPNGNNWGTTRIIGVPSGTKASPGKIYYAASAGFFIDTAGWPWSWGENTCGALGHGDTASKTAPKRIEWFVTNNFKVGSIVPVMTGDDTSCFGVYFLEDGGSRRVAYTGSHAYGAAGDGTVASGNKTAPVLVGGGAPLTNITYVHACGNPTTVLARDSGGTWYGWGANNGTCLGIAGTNFVSPQTITAMSGWEKALVGGHTIIALTSVGGGVRTCGRNYEGELGVGNTTALSGWQTPTGLGSGVVEIGISDGIYHTLFAITESTPGDRRLKTWGNNGEGSAGSGGTSAVTAPIEPSGAFQGYVVSAVVGGSNVGSGAYCATFVRTNSKIYASGYNGVLNLSIGISGNVSTFSEVLGIPVDSSISGMAICGSSAYFGLLVLTDKGCVSGGYHGNGSAGTGPTIANEPVLQPLWVSGIMGPKGDTGSGGVIAGTDSGVGTANALKVLLGGSIATGVAVRFTVFRVTTGTPQTVQFSYGGTVYPALTIKANDGTDPAAGYLTAGLQVLGFVDLEALTFRLVTDPAATTLAAAAATATTAANGAAAAASGAGAWHFEAEDQKTGGTAGGACIAGTQTRALNTIVRNTIGVTLSGNVATFPAGTYVFEWDAPAQACDGHKASLYNQAAGAVLKAGTSEHSNSSGDNVVTRSCGDHYVVLSASTAIRIDHYTATARATDGLGKASASGQVEVFTRLRARKLA